MTNIGALAARSGPIANQRTLSAALPSTPTNSKTEAPAISKAKNFLEQKLADLNGKGMKAKGMVADLDGDGKEEVLIVNAKGLLQIYKQNEDGEYSLDDTSDSNLHNIEDISVKISDSGKITAIVLKRGDITVDMIWGKPDLTSERPIWMVDPNKHKIFSADIDNDGIEDEVIVDVANSLVHTTRFDKDGVGTTESFSIQKLNEINLQLVDTDGDGNLELRVLDNNFEVDKTDKKGDTLYKRTVREFDEAIYNLTGDENRLRSLRHKQILKYVEASGPHGSYSMVFDASTLKRRVTA